MARFTRADGSVDWQAYRKAAVEAVERALDEEERRERERESE